MNDAFEISADPQRIDIERVHRWLSTDTYWATGRTRESVEQSIRASLNFGAYDEHGDQVAFARIVTDYSTFAWLCDVYVDRSARGQGLGTSLVAAVVDHLGPYELKRILLGTRDAHAVYAKVGFAPLPNPDNMMALLNSGSS